METKIKEIAAVAIDKAEKQQLPWRMSRRRRSRRL